MKKNLNIIQIKGIKGIIIAAFVVCCLATGFLVFPAWLLMNLWNYTSNFVLAMPTIGLFQGMLLWGIIAISYFLFRKERVVVCMKTPQGLSEEELKTVFADIKKQTQEDPILQAMIKAREAEIAYKSQQNSENKEIETTSADSTNS